MFSKIIYCVRLTRAHFLPASIIPFFVGVVYGLTKTAGDYFLPLLMGCGAVIAGHLSMNVLNDYCDHKSGVDENVAFEHPFSGGSRMIQHGEISVQKLFMCFVFLLCASLGFIFALALMLQDILIMICGIGLLLLGIAYSANPLRLSYRRFGEVTIFICFGLGLVVGGFYILKQTFITEVWLLALPMSFLIASVIICNEVPDYVSDEASGKYNLVSLFGLRFAYILYASSVAAAVISTLLVIEMGITQRASYWILLPYSIGVGVTYFLKKSIQTPALSLRACPLALLLYFIQGLVFIGALL